MNLFEPQANFVEHDAFLHALLGLMALSKRFDTLLPTAPRDESEIQTNASGLADTDSDSDEIVLAILGLVALNERFQCVIDEWTRGCVLNRSGGFPEELGFEEIKDLLR